MRREPIRNDRQFGRVGHNQKLVSREPRQYQYHLLPVWTATIPDERLPIGIETALFRIVQEALTNVVLHAQASRVDVLLSLKDHHISAMVEDDGVGFVPVSAMTDEQLGLFGMRERIEMLGGSLTIESSPGKGTTVKAEAFFDD